MNKNKKPRQFWIIDEYPSSTWVSSKALNSEDANEEIHVIEYFAYASLKAENEKLKNEVRLINEWAVKANLFLKLREG